MQLSLRTTPVYEEEDSVSDYLQQQRINIPEQPVAVRNGLDQLQSRNNLLFRDYEQGIADLNQLKQQMAERRKQKDRKTAQTNNELASLQSKADIWVINLMIAEAAYQSTRNIHACVDSIPFDRMRAREDELVDLLTVAKAIVDQVDYRLLWQKNTRFNDWRSLLAKFKSWWNEFLESLKKRAAVVGVVSTGIAIGCMVCAMLVNPWFLLITAATVIAATFFVVQTKKVDYSNMLWDPKMENEFKKLSSVFLKGGNDLPQLIETLHQLKNNLHQVNKKLIPMKDCDICMELMDGITRYPVNPNNAECRHILCQSCAEESIRKRKECPTCRLPATTYHRVCIKCKQTFHGGTMKSCEQGHKVCVKCVLPKNDECPVCYSLIQ